MKCAEGRVPDLKDVKTVIIQGAGGEFKRSISIEEYLDRDKFNIFFGPAEDGKTNDLIRIPKGSWNILDALIPHILKSRPGPIVELGMGESSQVFARHAFIAGVALHSCDLEMGGMFRVFDEPIFKDHFCFVGKSDDFRETYKFDFEPSIVFLDAEHTYKAVRDELNFFLPLLRDEGVIFMHDTFPSRESQIVPDKFGRKPGDVYLARQELERNPDIDVFTWPFTALGVGLTMVMKHKKDRPYWLKNGRAV